MIFIDRSKYNEPSIFSSEKIFLSKKRLKEFYQRPDRLRSQERYHRPFATEISSEILQALKHVFNNKCAYCESIVEPSSKGEIDHFRPKSSARGLDGEFSKDHYWWLVYNWENIYYSCQVCNRYKSTWFPIEGERAAIEADITQEKPLLIDPCKMIPSDHLFFKDDGKVDFLSPQGRVTIEILKLNREDLVHARARAILDVEMKWEHFYKNWNKDYKDKNILQEIIESWETILKLTSELPYLACRKQILLKKLESKGEIYSHVISKIYNNTDIAQNISSKISENLITKAALKTKEKKVIERSFDLQKLKHIYIEKIELKNYKCFSHIEIKFDNIEGLSNNKINIDKKNNEPWLLFLGENGVGKSSILKAISIALMSGTYRTRAGIQLSANDLLKEGEQEGFIKLYLKGQERPIEVKFYRDDKRLYYSEHRAITNFIGYGSIRLLPNKRIKPEQVRVKGIKSANLFDYSIALEDANNWLLNLSEEDFNRAASTLKDLMALKVSDRIVRNHEGKSVYVDSGSMKTSIDKLSDGYKSVYSLGVDIMSSLSDEKVTYDISEAIVLIDEIGTHLHPRWKMEVVSQLRRSFPRIQFIVTTHEPLCLRGLKAGEIVVLSKDFNGEVQAITDLPDPSELRMDQILTSEFFGLQSTLDPETEKIFDEYYSILAMDEHVRTDFQKSRLIELSNLVPKIKHLGDSLREDLVYFVIDELLAKRVKNEGFKIREELKVTALQRVKSLWESLDIEKEGH